ncbi:MAG: penicillin-binding protein 1C [Rhodothermales bacterium]
MRFRHRPLRLSPLRRALVTTAGAALLAGLASLLVPVPAGLLAEPEVVSVRVTDRAGALLREIRPDGRGIPIELDVLPAHVAEALVAIEDRYFYRHPGVNPLALLRAARDNAGAGHVVSGGSTITMQVARALRKSTRRTLFTKLAEAHLALRLEARLTKREILALWLNRVYFGNQAYGIEAAARTYFGKSASDLTLAEAAFLVGLPQSPVAFDPYRHADAARRRQQRVLNAMAATARLAPDEAARLGALPIPTRPPDQTFQAPHFVEFVRSQLGDRAGLAEVRTTLDARLQQTVEALARTHLARLNSENVSNAAVIVLDNATGDIRAYLGSADFWNAATGGQNDGVQARRQPGSALKPFTYALALESRRYTPASILADLEIQIPEAGGAFAPQNYDRTFHGPVPLREALANSYNVPAVRVAREIGPASILDRLHAFGLASLDRPAEHYGVGITLGNGEVRLIELARAYAGLARGGALPALRAIASITSLDGAVEQPAPPATAPRVIAPDVAYLMADILSDPEARQAAFGRYGPLELPFPAAVKTGTTKDYRDNWAVGFTPAYTVGVWVGNFDGSPMQRVSGVSGAGPLFKSILLELGPGGAFDAPAGVADAVVCPASGKLPGAACPVRKRIAFLAGSIPTDTCAVHRRYDIDRRNGLLADADTPASARQSITYAVHPPEYREWMRERGMPLPPTVTLAQAAARDEAPSPHAGLRVAYPISGARFQLDPVLRRGYQRIKLQAVVDETLVHPEWWVDGAAFPGSIDEAFLALAPGTHTIELRARTLEGDAVRSLPARIAVIDPLEEPASLPDPRVLGAPD